MSDKKSIDKPYLLETLRNFDRDILNKKYGNNSAGCLPAGGITGQVLVKASDNDNDVKWDAIQSGGDTGKSAYEIAVDNGFNGTETEWLESLKGENGQPGVKGDKGDKGDSGEDGISPAISEIIAELKQDTDFVASIKGEPGEDANIDNITPESIGAADIEHNHGYVKIVTLSASEPESVSIGELVLVYE